MAIVKQPQRPTFAGERQAEAFIAAGTQPAPQKNMKAVTIHVDPDILVLIDKAAKGLGLSRSAYLVSSAVERIRREDSK